MKTAPEPIIDRHGPRPVVLGRPAPADWRRLRERHHMSQHDLAALVYRSVDAIRKWEQGRGDGDLACWHLALLLLGELTPKKKRRPTLQDQA